MITGFNTDIEHDGVVYHVQTEDKGLETPLILSLVYTGGAILASKRVRYDDLVAAGFDEKTLAERLQRQHKLICAAIRAGRLEDLKKMSGRENSRAKADKARRDGDVVVLETFAAEPAIVTEPISLHDIPATTPAEAVPVIPATPPSPLKSRRKADAERDVVPAADRAPSQPERNLPPPRRRATQTLRAPRQRPVTDFGTAEIVDNTGLQLGLIDERHYRGGDRVTLRARLTRGAERKEVVENADVIVKILGSTFRPLILQTKTGGDGVATFIIQLPHFRSGRAAILLRATSDGLEAELRRIIQQG